MTAKRNASGNVRVKVTASFANAGANELGVVRRSVRGATVKLGGKTVKTNAKGIAVISGARGKTVRVAAGHTFKLAKARVR